MTSEPTRERVERFVRGQPERAAETLIRQESELMGLRGQLEGAERAGTEALRRAKAALDGDGDPAVKVSVAREIIRAALVRAGT